MKTRTAIPIVATLLALTGCTESEPKTHTPAPAPTTARESVGTKPPTTEPTPAASVTASRQQAAEQAAGLPPVPQADEARAFVTRLRAIDADIVAGASSEALINRGRDQCTTIYGVTDEQYHVTTANVRFATVTNPSGFGDKAADINAAVKKYICPKNWN